MVRDVLGVRSGLEHAALYAKLPLRPLEPLEGELVEAAVVELADVGDEADPERLAPRLPGGPGPARGLLVVAAATRSKREDGQCEEDGGLHAVGLRLTVANSMANHTTLTHTTLAVVLQVRQARLQVLLWKRARDPFSGSWALPGGYLEGDETLEESIRRHLAAKVDVRRLSHLEQLETRSEPRRHPRERQLATTHLGLIPVGIDPRVPEDTAWHPVDGLPPIAFDHEAITLAGCERLRAKLSYTNIGFALAPDEFTISELREIYEAALGHRVTTTNLQRVLLRRGVLDPTGGRREPGPAGGRPASVYRFRSSALKVTDPFAVLRPPAA